MTRLLFAAVALATMFWRCTALADDLAATAAEPDGFRLAGITETWVKYADRLRFGEGQTLALVDDGCNLSMPEWTTTPGMRPKVIATYDSIDGDSDPKHEGRGYHGSTIGIPSSVNHNGKRGVAFNDQVAVIRAVECCHCSADEDATLAAGLQWVIDHHAQYRITAVNLAPVDDKTHDKPLASKIDAQLAELRKLGIWVSAPCGNHDYTKGISWPACQRDCFAIGAVQPNKDVVHLDRDPKVALVVPAAATSSSNAIACGAAIVLREAIDKSVYDWRGDGPNLPEAMLAIFRRTGAPVEDPATGLTFRRLDLLAAVDHVFRNAKRD